jgi:hypothetical protein
MTIFLSSLISFIIQFKTISMTPEWQDLLYVFVGVIGAQFFIKYLLKQLNQSTTLILRRSAYSLIVVYTLINLTLRG